MLRQVLIFDESSADKITLVSFVGMRTLLAKHDAIVVFHERISILPGSQHIFDCDIASCRVRVLWSNAEIALEQRRSTDKTLKIN